MVGNRLEDVTKVEELADERLLAALVANLDMEVCLEYPTFVVSEPLLMLLFVFTSLLLAFCSEFPWILISLYLPIRPIFLHLSSFFQIPLCNYPKFPFLSLRSTKQKLCSYP